MRPPFLLHSAWPRSNPGAGIRAAGNASPALPVSSIAPGREYPRQSSASRNHSHNPTRGLPTRRQSFLALCAPAHRSCPQAIARAPDPRATLAVESYAPSRQESESSPESSSRSCERSLKYRSFFAGNIPPARRPRRRHRARLPDARARQGQPGYSRHSRRPRATCAFHGAAKSAQEPLAIPGKYRRRRIHQPRNPLRLKWSAGETARSDRSIAPGLRRARRSRKLLQDGVHGTGKVLDH